MQRFINKSIACSARRMCQLPRASQAVKVQSRPFFHWFSGEDSSMVYIPKKEKKKDSKEAKKEDSKMKPATATEQAPKKEEKGSEPSMAEQGAAMANLAFSAASAYYKHSTETPPPPPPPKTRIGRAYQYFKDELSFQVQVITIIAFVLGGFLTYKEVKYRIRKLASSIFKNGFISNDFIRVVEKPRAGYASKVEADGLTYHDLDGYRFNSFLEKASTYWNEEASIQVSEKAEKELIEATFTLHNMCLEVVERVIEDDVMLELFEIPPDLWPAIRKSWKDKKPDLMGRFDFSWNGRDPPKLLEYNADTPSVFVESGLAQLHWQEEKHPNAYQSNYMVPAFQKGLASIASRLQLNKYDEAIGICQTAGDRESEGTAKYIQRLVEGANLKSKLADIGSLRFNYSGDEVSMTLDDEPVSSLIKLYPLEWMIDEVESADVFGADLEEVNMIEPAWKLILGNKALLPLLWEMYPNHPNLLPAYFIDPKEQLEKQSSEDDNFKKNSKDLEIKDWVAKPKYGREGIHIQFSKDYSSYQDFVQVAKSQSERSKNFNNILVGKPIFQQYCPLPEAKRAHILTSSWVIHGAPAGLCFREDKNEVTNNNSEFLPHFVTQSSSQIRYQFKADKFQQRLREQLYGQVLDPSVYSGSNDGAIAELAELSEARSASHVSHCYCGGGCPSYRRAEGILREKRDIAKAKSQEHGRRPLSKSQLQAKRARITRLASKNTTSKKLFSKSQAKSTPARHFGKTSSKLSTRLSG